MKQLELDGAGVEEFEKKGTGALAKAVKGDVENGSIMAGQIVGMVKEIKPCKDIIMELVNDTKKVISEINSMILWD